MSRRKQLQISNKIKISSAARNVLILFAIVIFAFGSGNLIKALTTRKDILPESKEVYKYTNKMNTNANINLVSNEYITEEEITEEQTYLSDLISNIDIDLNYNYTGTKETDIIYKYKVEAIVSATYKSNNKSYDVLNKIEKIKESEDTQITGNSFSINEKITADYTKYHKMIKRFKQEMGISTDSHLYIRLTVNTKTSIDSKQVESEYVSDYSISLGEKIALIDYKEKDEKSDSIKYEIQKESVKDIKTKDVLISIAIMVIGLLLLRFILRKTENLKTIRNEFKLELNRIMRSCESKLVEIEDLKQIDLSTATRVKDISQLLKLSDEALVPIYCYIKDEPEQEAYFIVTKYEKSYIFILR